ncbi:TolC family protein [Aestuariibacter sp. A3R04]|uniref:TolC family protein n=1 Tax=Aestuariibacter sp. A3R04 TaxID=2841571 RepID=UPI001C0A388F|nr:TolC family protein [Aestuariibacter sp. A3R04]MBU3020824.1 TolC family protein [Aestuariibacter sp. A3R04]
MLKRSACLLWALLLSGCAYQPQQFDNRKSDVAEQVFAPYRQDVEHLRVEARWWHVFTSPNIDMLMDRLMENNLSLDEAALRLERMKLLLRQAEADNVPAISASVNGRSGEELDSGRTTNSSSAGVGFNYTLDIWGSREASQLAAALDIDVQSYSMKHVALQVQQLLISEYVNWLSLSQRIKIAEQNLEAATRLYDLVNIRFEEGDASGIEVSQQQNTLLSAKGELLRLHNERSFSGRAIAVLLGDESMAPRLPQATIQALSLPEIELYQPAVVLMSRPDMQIADIALRQADIGVYQAGIQGLPGLSLSADVGVSEILDLASGWSLGAALSSVATLYAGGRIEAGKKIADTDLELAWNNYRVTALNAAKGLLDALDNYKFQKQSYALNEASVVNNERLYRLAEIRYKAGDTDFLNLLSAQRSWFQAQLALISSYQQTLNAAVNVYIEAGGRPVVE